MAKKEISGIASELRKLMADNKIVIGIEQTINLLKKGKVQKVYIASNCDETMKKNLERLCSISGKECITLKETNEDIGVICKKQFAISVVSIV